MTFEGAEAFLDSRALYGWRFGLDRMHRLLSAMGMPQRRYASIHVVGTNGKSSVARMVAAILEQHGLRTGTYLSPHLVSWRERVHLGGEPIGEAPFGEAVEIAAAATTAVERGLEADDFVTQFEAGTAAALQAFAAARVDVAVVEAGLGGRLDATNVLPSKVTVLTSVGLEHTEWLGETVRDIAAEKLAVVRDRTSLVVGVLSPEAAAEAQGVAHERHARLVVAPTDPGPGVTLRAAGIYQRQNFAVAAAAAEAFLGELRPEAVHAAAAVQVPGRMELIEGDPPVLVDVAHNPDGMRALVESLPTVAAGRPVVACVAILSDKDAEAMLAILLPHVTSLVATEVGGSRARPAAELARLCRKLGSEAVEVAPDPKEALERARTRAREAGGVALVTGSHYLLSQLWTGRRDPSWSR